MSTATATATKPKGTSPTLPFDPLWEKARAIAGANGPIGPAFTPLEFAELVGHNVKAIKRWEQAGSIPWTSADRAAVRMGVHPMAVWGYDWLEIMGDYDEIAAGEMDASIERALVKVGKRMEEDLLDQMADEALDAENSIFINEDGEIDFDPEIEMSMSDVYALEGILEDKGLL